MTGLFDMALIREARVDIQHSKIPGLHVGGSLRQFNIGPSLPYLGMYCMAWRSAARNFVVRISKRDALTMCTQHIKIEY